MLISYTSPITVSNAVEVARRRRLLHLRPPAADGYVGGAMRVGLPRLVAWRRRVRRWVQRHSVQLRRWRLQLRPWSETCLRVLRSCRRWHAVLRGRHLWRMQVQGRGNEAGCQPRRATQHTRTKQTLPSPLLGAPRRRRSDRSLRRRHVRSRQRHPPLFGRRRARALTGQGVRLTVPHVSCAKEPSEYLQEGTRREI